MRGSEGHYPSLGSFLGGFLVWDCHYISLGSLLYILVENFHFICFVHFYYHFVPNCHYVCFELFLLSFLAIWLLGIR